MKLSSLTLSHSVFPIEIREKMAFSDDQAIRFLMEMSSRSEIDNALIISTCNRTELFIAVENERRGESILSDTLQRWSMERNFTIPANSTQLILGHSDSIDRLLRVASGLESQLLGEGEVLGQVRLSIDLSKQAGVDGRIIRKLWEKALRCGKRVRTETALGDGALSVAYGALQVARKIHGDLCGLNFCVVGAGEVAELVLKHLQGIKGANITILNRSHEHAEFLAEVYGATLGEMDALGKHICDADVVISSTGSQQHIIDTELVRSSLAGRARALLLVDLGVPRDIDPEARSLQQVFLYNIDDLARMIEGHLDSRRAAIPDAEEIVQHECRQFEVWIGNQQLGPAIRSLRKALEDASQKELDLLRDELDVEVHDHLSKLMRKVVKKVLHRPTEELRTSGTQLSDALLTRLESLFQGDDTEEQKKEVE